MEHEATSSKFHFWRAVIALAHVDGKVHPGEAEFIRRRLGSFSWTPGQREQLEREIDAPAPDDLSEIYSGVTEPGDRAQILHFVRLMFHSDGDYAPEEAKAFHELESEVLAGVDLAEAVERAKAIGPAREFRPQGGAVMQALDRITKIFI